MKAFLPAGAIALFFALTVFGADMSAPRTLKIGPSTQIKLDGSSATASQLKTGFSADISEDSFQPGFANEVDAHTPTPKGGSKIPPPKPGTKPAAGGTQGGKVGKDWVITAVSADSITISLQ